MANKDELNKLTEAMRGAKCTAGWDAVCSYTASQINIFLQAQYDANKLAKKIAMKTTTPDILSDKNLTITYDLSFGSPAISFATGRSGYCQVDMPILAGSSYTIQADGSNPLAPVQIPAGHTVRATVPLAAASGATGKVTELDNVVTFSEGADETQHVILHFKTAKGIQFSIVPEPSDKGRLDVLLMPLLLNHFQNEVDQLQYALASVNNKPATAGSTVLTPQSFVFASFGEGDGALSLYIQVQGSGHPAGDLNPAFQPNGRAAVPIPPGSTASIILSYDLITSVYLRPQLLQQQYAQVDFVAADHGIVAKLRSPQNVVVDGKDSNFIFGNCSFDGMNISLNDFPVLLSIQDEKVRVQWTGTGTSSWSNSGMGGNSYGKVDVTFSVDKSAAVGSLSDNDLSIATVSVGTGDFARSTDSHSCSFWERTFGHCSTSVPNEYNTLPLHIPDISLHLPNLDFFATTNLLAPGKHVIDFDRDAGVQTPHDFLMVGSVRAA